MSAQSTGIIAIVTTQEESVKGGGVPVFIVENKSILQKLSTSLERITDASAHELDENTMIIVAH